MREEQRGKEREIGGSTKELTSGKRRRKAYELEAPTLPYMLAEAIRAPNRSHVAHERVHEDVRARTLTLPTSPIGTGCDREQWKPSRTERRRTGKAQ